MNGDRNGYWFSGGVAIAIGLVLSSAIFGWFFATTKRSDEAITVTGSARKRIKSDLVVWTAAVTYQAPKVADAYRSLSESVPKVKQYLIGKGIAEDQITISSITTTSLKKTDTNGGETSEITGYSLKQQLEVRSNDVDKIARIAREATELINQDILIESNAPQFYYTQLGDLKIEMLGDAAKDAKTRAERIAASTGNKIGHGGAYNTNSYYDVDRGLILIFLVQHAGWKDEGKKIQPAFQNAALKEFAPKK